MNISNQQPGIVPNMEYTTNKLKLSGHMSSATTQKYLCAKKTISHSTTKMKLGHKSNSH